MDDLLHNSLTHATFMVTLRGRILAGALSFRGKINPVNHMFGNKEGGHEAYRIDLGPLTRSRMQTIFREPDATTGHLSEDCAIVSSEQVGSGSCQGSCHQNAGIQPGW